MIEHYNQILAQSFIFGNMTLQTAVFGFIGVHILLSLAVCLLAYTLPTTIVDSYERFLLSYSSPQPVLEAPKHTFRQKLGGVLKDLTSPIFLLSLLLSAFFFYATLHSLGAFFFAFFRLIAMAFLTFFLIRNIPTEWCIAFSRNYISSEIVHLMSRKFSFASEIDALLELDGFEHWTQARRTGQLQK